MRLIPAPRGTAIVGAPTSKKLLQFAGVEDVFTSTRGSTKTLENFVKATFRALSKTYSFLTPELWKKTDFIPSPFIRFSDKLERDGDRNKRRGGAAGRARQDGRDGRGGRGGRGRGEGRGRGGRGRGEGRGRGGPRPTEEAAE